MSWLWGSSAAAKEQQQQLELEQQPNMDDPSSSNVDMSNDMSPYSNRPIFALDQIKNAGMPIQATMSPYLQMDPSIFRESTPQYILPDGGTTGKGKFEFALGNIGWAVAGGYAVGVARGFIPEFFNPDTRQLRGKSWVTRVVNATVKHGSGYAQPAGAAVFMFSIIEILLRKVRPDDDFNSILAGGLTGAIYRSPYGLRAAAIGSGVGLLLATIWIFVNPESRERVKEVLNYS
uniref:Mitochondrial import inner membrane translocase subunit TIM23 n=1 Tax=Syphacia muris TaxID=451379 RepID=A0A0N5AWJ6_9BILA